MKTKVVFVADDGTEWANAEDAIRADGIHHAVSKAMQDVPDLPPSGVRISLNPATMMHAKRQIVEICRQLWPDEPVFKHAAEKIHPLSYAGRFISECSYQSVRKAWKKFMYSNDTMTWMYDQTYFAQHEAEWMKAFGKK